MGDRGRERLRRITKVMPVYSRYIHMTRHAFVFVFLTAAAALCAEDFTGKVLAITDGDTIRVLHDGKAERIQLWGIEAPESKQPFGARAKQFTGDLACRTNGFGEGARYGSLRQDGGGNPPAGPQNLNHEIVRAGFASWYRRLPNKAASWYVWRRRLGRRSGACGPTRTRSRRASGARCGARL
jgi:hypothetical protein